MYIQLYASIAARWRHIDQILPFKEGLYSSKHKDHYLCRLRRGLLPGGNLSDEERVLVPYIRLVWLVFLHKNNARIVCVVVWNHQDSNLRPSHYKSEALTVRPARLGLSQSYYANLYKINPN